MNTNTENKIENELALTYTDSKNYCEFGYWIDEYNNLDCRIITTDQTAKQKAAQICKAVNNYDSLLNALKKIYDESASLDNGVNDAGDKQISRLWEIAYKAITENK